MRITHLNPETMYRSPVFSQAVVVDGPARTVYVGGQNGITADGRLAGDDLATQTEQALRNVLEVLRHAGATQEHVVKLGIHLLHGQDVRAGYEAAQKVWGTHATAITGVLVAGLAFPGALVEIDAVAVVEPS